MKIIAYSYSNPLWESSVDTHDWGYEVDEIYEDLGGRWQLEKLIKDCQGAPANYLVIRRVQELGDSLEEVSDRLHKLEALGTIVVTIEQSYTADLCKILKEVSYYSVYIGNLL